jgi:hypothetical protein
MDVGGFGEVVKTKMKKPQYHKMSTFDRVIRKEQFSGW